MKRILKTGILILAVMMGASACAGSGSAQEDDVKNSDSPSFEDGIYTGSFTTIKETDKGFYYITRKECMVYDEFFDKQVPFTGSFIIYYDKNSEKSIPVCNKPDCMHDTDECNAYIGNNYAGESLVIKSLCADDEYLYYVVTEKEYSDEAKKLIEKYEEGTDPYTIGTDRVNYYTNVYLCRMKEDGTSKDRLMKLDSVLNTYEFYPKDSGKTNKTADIVASNMYIKGGKLYYAFFSDEAYHLREIDLQKKEQKDLLSADSEKIQSLSLTLSKEYLWFQAQYIGDMTWTEGGKFTGYSADIYVYDIASQTVKKAAEKIVDARNRGMMADGSRMYYSGNNEMWYLDAASPEKHVLCTYEDPEKTYYSPIPYNDKLIVCRMDQIEVYDKSGKKLGTIAFDEVDVTKGGQSTKAVTPAYIALIGVGKNGDMIVECVNEYRKLDDNDKEKTFLERGYYILKVEDGLKGEIGWKKLFEVVEEH